MPWEAGRVHAGFTTAEKSWLPVPYQHAALAVDKQEADSDSVLQHYRHTLAFRKAHPALVDGDLTFINTKEDVLAFTREKHGETMLFVFNLARKPVQVALPKGMRVKEVVPMPGFVPGASVETVKLDALDVFCGRL
jgi:alpha-glucosidase